MIMIVYTRYQVPWYVVPYSINNRLLQENTRKVTGFPIFRIFACAACVSETAANHDAGSNHPGCGGAHGTQNAEARKEAYFNTTATEDHTKYNKIRTDF